MSVQTQIQTVAPSEAVVDRMADLEGVEPTALTPLFEAIDPEALDALVESVSYPTESDLRIEFSYHGYDVAVTGEGVVHIDEPGRMER